MSNLLKSKWKIVISGLCIVTLLFMVSTPMVNAATLDKKEPTHHQQQLRKKQVKKVANQLRFLFTQAVVDKNGKLSFNRKKIAKKFGRKNVGNIIQLVRFLHQPKTFISPKQNMLGNIQSNGLRILPQTSFYGCMENKILDALGWEVFKTIIAGGGWALIKRKAFKEAAEVIVRAAVDLDVVLLAAQLAWWSSECAGWNPLISKPLPAIE